MPCTWLLQLNEGGYLTIEKVDRKSDERMEEQQHLPKFHVDTSKTTKN